MALYIHQRKDWPQFYWDSEVLVEALAQVRNQQGKLTGKMESIGFEMQNEAYVEALSEEVVKSSAIEGEILDVQHVRSSIASRLGVDIGGLEASDRNVEGIVDMMMNATQQWPNDLDKERLFAWHAALFPSGRSGMHTIAVGCWRDDQRGPMRVVSGPMGKETVHFTAPDASVLPLEMQQFFDWINQASSMDPVLKAAIAHLWFITIHPFDDGNGRIARAITDMLLCRSEGKAQRFYSMSSAIEKQKKGYYSILESTQKGSLDVTDWLMWFLQCLNEALMASAEVVEKIMTKHAFWNSHRSVSFNERQVNTIERLLGTFFGHLTTSKWAKMNKCSQDTALRDIQDLIDKAVLVKSSSGGRSTHYALILPNRPGAKAEKDRA
jgi:Fic family protein